MPYIVLQFLHILLNVLSLAVLGRALLSWFDPIGRNPLSRFLIDVTEPILRPIRSLMPAGMMLDFSPIIAILLIQLIQRALPAP